MVLEVVGHPDHRMVNTGDKQETFKLGLHSVSFHVSRSQFVSLGPEAIITLKEMFLQDGMISLK